MKIYIKVTPGLALTLDVKQTDKINDIKKQIQNKIGISKDQQCLIFHNRIVKNWHTLQDYPVENNSTFQLIIMDSVTSDVPKEEPESGIICKSCGKSIPENQEILYSGYNYHKKCIKCQICNKSFDENNDLNEFISVTPGMFFCHQHYTDYLKNQQLPQNVIDSYHELNLKNFVNELFEPQTFKNVENGYQKNDLFNDTNLSNDSYQIDKPYEDFIPTAEFHFDISIDKVDFDQLRQLLGDDEAIIGIKSGSLILKIALVKKFGAAIINMKDKIKETVANMVEKVKERFNSSIGKAVVGNLIDSAKITVPDTQKIQELYHKKSMNILQNSYELNDIEIDNIIDQVIDKAKKEDVKKNWKYIISQQDIFNEAEKHVRNDISNNKFEMIIIGETIIANKYNEEYEHIKKRIQKCGQVEEIFLYHGTKIANQQNIVKTHFYMPGKDAMTHTLDEGYFGKGIYATENLFYACLYGNGYQVLQPNQKTNVFLCRSIFNLNKVTEMNQLHMGEAISPDIVNNFGINHAYVGNTTGFHPISPSDFDKNDIAAEEFVFPNKYQIIPICSFMVMRTDHLILWKDDNINNEENSEYMKELTKKIEVNVYGRKTWEEAVEVLKLKKHNRIKLITNGGAGLTGKKLIEEARKIIGSNFVCLVFANSAEHLDWVLKMENVLFTNDPETFRKFASLGMTEKEVLDYIDFIEKSKNIKFNINQKELLNFPLANKV
ncbi:hypothetical protein M9Y10_005740 [Tritrichomonas musculus]|uniref:PARP n=1 Tax=Tritrichomonas musculus TaxID=1915356 RepID=A0ABR2JCW1_9EUKA